MTKQLQQSINQIWGVKMTQEEQLKIQQEHARQGKFGEMNEAEIEELEKWSEEKLGTPFKEFGEPECSFCN